jgi:hypothetical protein
MYITKQEYLINVPRVGKLGVHEVKKGRGDEGRR